MTFLNKTAFLVIVTLFPFFACGQKETLTFKISKPQSEIKLHTVDSVFHLKKMNPLFVEITGKNKVFRVTAINGTVKRKPNNYFEIRFKSPGETLIKVYEKTPDGTMRLGIAQAFKVVAPPQPTVYVCGVKSDSVIDRKHLLKVAQLSAELKGSRIIPAVLSFDMIIPSGDTIHVEGNKFPIQLRNQLIDIDEGQVLIFLNIRVLMPDRGIAIVQEVMVFIAKTDQYSVGHRNETIKKEDN